MEEPSFTTLEGLKNLTRVGGDLIIGIGRYTGFIHFDVTVDADFLTSLRGLDNLTEVGGSLWIIGHSGLTSLDGLQNLRQIGGHPGVTLSSAVTSKAWGCRHGRRIRLRELTIVRCPAGEVCPRCCSRTAGTVAAAQTLRPWTDHQLQIHSLGQKSAARCCRSPCSNYR